VRVRVSSYQSIASTEIEAVGFTAVTGPSNIGKSALLRAVSAALFGQDGDHFVRKGAAACAVTVEHDGHVIEWQKVRRKKPGLENCVVVDGEKFTRLGKGHAELIGPLGYQTIKTGGEHIRPQYATQYDDIFLLTATPNTAAEVFKMLGRVDVVTRAHGAARCDLRKTGSELEIRTRDQEAAWESLCELGWVEIFEESYRQLDAGVSQRLAEAAQASDHWALIREIELFGDPRVLPEEPELPDVAPVADLLRRVEEFEALAPRGELPREPDLTGLVSEAGAAAQALARIAAFEDALRAENKAVADLEAGVGSSSREPWSWGRRRETARAASRGSSHDPAGDPL
jgi:energy-coupling factor transporter ATP-binding protein EcfA2